MIWPSPRPTGPSPSTPIIRIGHGAKVAAQVYIGRPDLALANLDKANRLDRRDGNVTIASKAGAVAFKPPRRRILLTLEKQSRVA